MKRTPRILRSIHRQSKQKLIIFEVGSSRTRIKQGQKLVYDQPSCIAINSQENDSDFKGGRVLAIGDKAYQLLGKKRQSLQVEFPVRNGSVASPVIFAKYMHHILQRLDIQSSWWQQLAGRQCLIAVSDTLSPAEKEVTKNQFAQLQLGQLEFMAAELAATNNLGRNEPNSAESYCLINMGGMITTVAIIQRGVIVNSTRLFVGGMQMTASIQQQIRAEHALAISWHEAERIKHSIGRVGVSDGSKKASLQKMSVQGKDLTSQLGRTAVVGSDQIKAGLSNHLADLILGLQHFFASVPTELVTNSLQNGILLTGGASQLAGANRELERQLQAQVLPSDSPAFDVVDGLENAAATNSSN